MNCPLCQRKMKVNYRTLNEGPVRGYDDVFSCEACEAVITIKVQVHPDLFKTVNPE